MRENKIAFIICTNDEYYLDACKSYIRKLKVPEGYEIDIVEIRGAGSMAAGYNEGRRRTDAKYKVYLHQDVFIVYPLFIQSLLDIFSSDEKIGMVGMVGTPQMPPGGVMWYGEREGQLYTLNECAEEYAEYVYKTEDGLHNVQAVDGLLMATCKDVPWREDLFDGWDFYDVSQSFEYLRAGHLVVVPEQRSPWVMHFCGQLNLKNYNRYRKIMLEEYRDILCK